MNSDHSDHLAPLSPPKKNKETVAVIGGGWFGCHIAIALQERGYLVTLYEGKSTIFSGISGTFGIRIHSGPHYTRSYATRKCCREVVNRSLKIMEDRGAIRLGRHRVVVLDKNILADMAKATVETLPQYLEPEKSK